MGKINFSAIIYIIVVLFIPIFNVVTFLGKLGGLTYIDLFPIWGTLLVIVLFFLLIVQYFGGMEEIARVLMIIADLMVVFTFCKIFNLFQEIGISLSTLLHYGVFNMWGLTFFIIAFVISFSYIIPDSPPKDSVQAPASNKSRKIKRSREFSSRVSLESLKEKFTKSALLTRVVGGDRLVLTLISIDDISSSWRKGEKRIVSGKKFKIGRDKSWADIIIGRKWMVVSRKHALLEVVDRKLYYIPLKRKYSFSVNNNVHVHKIYIGSGDTLSLISGYGPQIKILYNKEN